MGRLLSSGFVRSRKAAVMVATGSVLAVGAFSFAGTATAASGVTPDDSRATTQNGNINSCGAAPTLLVGGTTSASQNGITVTVTHLAAAQPNPHPAGRFVTLPKGTAVLTVVLPSGTTLSGNTYVKGGNGYNIYPGSALTSLIPPANGGSNIAGLSHYLICGTLTPTTGSVSVKKVVSGSGPGSDGPFSVTVNCGTGHTSTLSLDPGETKTVDSIPDGTGCTVTESASGADSTTYTVDGGSSSTTAPTFNAVGNATKAVVVTNTYLTNPPPPTGSVKVTKQVTGTPPDGLGSFALSLDCAGDVTSLSLADGDSQTVSGIADGTSCTLTEPDNKNASSTTFTIDGGTAQPTATFDVTGNHETDVTVDNHYDPATLTVAKVVTGDAIVNGPFSVSVDCGGQNTFDFTLDAGDSHEIDNLPGGSQCAVNETDADGATSTTYTVDGGSPSLNKPTVDLAVGDSRTVTITNDFESAPTATLTVTKSVTGSNPSDGPFAVEVQCGFDQVLVELRARDALFTVLQTDDFTLNAGGTHSITGLADGESCTVTETDSQGATSTTYTVDAGTPVSDPPTVVVTGGDTTTVAITNNFPVVSPPPPGPATLTVTKSVTGTDPSDGPFDVHIDCGADGTFDMVLNAGGSDSVDTLPGGASCTVTETDSQGATSTSYSVDSGTAQSDPPTVDLTAGDTTVVAITNDYEPAPPPAGTLTIHKSVDKKVADYGSQLNYTLHVSAGATDQHTVVVTDEVPQHTTFVAAGCVAPCSVSGPTNGIVTWDVGDMAAGTSVDLTMAVRVDEPTGDTAPAEKIVNVAIAGSQEDPIVPSNPVKTRINRVLGEHITRHHHHHHHKTQVKAVHHTNTGSTLPFTGLAARSLGGFALLLIGLGAALEMGARRRRRS